MHNMHHIIRLQVIRSWHQLLYRTTILRGAEQSSHPGDDTKPQLGETVHKQVNVPRES